MCRVRSIITWAPNCLKSYVIVIAFTINNKAFNSDSMLWPQSQNYSSRENPIILYLK